MQVTAKLGSVRITPRKIGLVADQVRGKTVHEALEILDFSPRKRTAGVIATLVRGAIANMLFQGQAETSASLYIHTLLVGQGMTIKRFRARAKGSGTRINKKTSNIRIVLGDWSK